MFYSKTSTTYLHVNVLLDTGALGANYMSKEVADWFTTNGTVLVVDKLTRVCTAFNDCNITFINVNNTDDFNLSFDLTFKIVYKIPCEIIIGLNTIKDNNMWHLFNLKQLAIDTPSLRRTLMSQIMTRAANAPSDGNSITELAQADPSLVVSNAITGVSPQGTTHTSQAISKRKYERSTLYKLPAKALRIKAAKKCHVNDTGMLSVKNSYVTNTFSGALKLKGESEKYLTVDSEEEIYTGDRGYSSSASITGIERNQRQLGTQQGELRAIDGNLSLDSGGVMTPATEALTSNMVNTGPDKQSKLNLPKVNRAHISEYIHYEERGGRRNRTTRGRCPRVRLGL
jgi:hypothetical protein